MARQFKSVEPIYVRLGDGVKEIPSIEGYLINAQDFNYRRGDAGVRYIVRSEEGVDYQFLGGAQLNPLMELVSIGEYIRVTFVEELDTGQPSPAKIYKVEVASE